VAGTVAGGRRAGPQRPQLGARRLGLPLSTVGGILRPLGLGKIAGIGHRITGRRSGMINRHRGIGWEALHVAIDDASRLSYSEILPDARQASATAFLDRAAAWFGRHGVTIERVMTDNGNAYRSHAFRDACAAAGIRHLRTKPYTPRTTDEVEQALSALCMLFLAIAHRRPSGKEQGVR
jgi:hypothetical protein